MLFLVTDLAVIVPNAQTVAMILVLVVLVKMAVETLHIVVARLTEADLLIVGVGETTRGFPRHPSSHRGGVTSRSDTNACHYCGGPSSHASCPAKGKERRRCHKMNHFAHVCISKTEIRQIRSNSFVREHGREYRSLESSDESVFKVSDRPTSKTPAITANILKTKVNFLIDTGASVNILKGHDYDKHCVKPKLQSPSPLIYAYGSKDPLSVRGFFSANIAYKGKHANAGFYVVNINGSQSQSHNLLSADTAQALNIVRFAFSSSVSTSIPDQFPSLFDGQMGKIDGGTVRLHIDTSVQPKAQRHRRIPLHTRKDVEAELERLEKLDVIEKVTGPTPCISPVVVLKKNKGVSVC